MREQLNRYFTKQGNKKWVKALPKLVDAYNHSIHRALGLRPVDVSSKNAFDM